MSRLDEMTPALKLKYAAFAAKMGDARIPFGLNEVLRTTKRQLAYACQGRTYEELIALLLKSNWVKSVARVRKLQVEGKTIQETCDIFRGEDGLYLLKGKEWRKITWKMNSYHIANSEGLSRAFDIKIFTPNGQPNWNEKWDADMDGISEYKEAAELGRSVGLKPGADFGDWPHFQL